MLCGSALSLSYSDDPAAGVDVGAQGQYWQVSA